MHKVIIGNPVTAKQGFIMSTQPKSEKSGPLATLAKNYSGPLTAVALSALSAWLMVEGMKGLAGFTLTTQSAAADLIGIVLIIVVARWMNGKPTAK